MSNALVEAAKAANILAAFRKDLLVVAKWPHSVNPVVFPVPVAYAGDSIMTNNGTKFTNGNNVFSVEILDINQYNSQYSFLPYVKEQDKK
jgi:hypothetical protein